MAELLVVVDSAAKADFMKEYFGDRATCVVCEGPLFKTSHQISPGAPAGLLFHFEGIPSAQKSLDALHAFQGKEILLALDENAPANYLCWQVSSYVAQIGGRSGAVKRVNITAFSKEAMAAALHSAWTVEASPAIAFYSRQLFDECLAHHLVRLLGTDRGPDNLPLRKNSLSMLFLLAEREQERSMFPLVPKWQLQAKLAIDGKDTRFTAYLAKGMDLAADGLIANEAKARTLRDQFWQAPFTVDSRSSTPLMMAAPEPYQLPELLHDALVLLGLHPLSTMEIVRKLFHGVPVNGRSTGLISSPLYHRRRVSPVLPQGGQNGATGPGVPTLGQELVSALRQQVVTLYGEPALAEGPLPTLGMILPVIPGRSGADLAEVLSQDEATLYELVRMRALASQMHPAVGRTVTIDFLAGRENIFQAHFHEVDDPGFLRTAPREMARIQTSVPVSDIKDGQEFVPIEIECEPILNEGQGAEPYTLETLLAALSDFSIAPEMGTIAMLDRAIKAGYASISKQGSLKAGENTAKVVAILNRAFPQMQGLNLAAYIEQTIAEAATARKELPFALKQFDQTLMLHGKILVKAKIPVKVQPRARTSSTIIKQAAATLAGPSATTEGQPSADPAANLQTQEATPPAPALGQETIAAERPGGDLPESPSSTHWHESGSRAGRAGEWSQEMTPAEDAPATERAREDASGSATPPEQVVSDAWADADLQKIFAEAVSGKTVSSDDAKLAPSPAADGTPGPDRIGATAAELRPCPACGKPLRLHQDHFGVFWQCSGFPGCRYSEAQTQVDNRLVCPLCDHVLARKQTPTGKSFYVCGNQECQFMSWSIPHYLPCGLCDSPYLVEKTVHGIPQLRCPRAGCPYGQPFAAESVETRPLPVATAGKKVLVRRVAPGATPGGATKMVRIVRRRK